MPARRRPSARVRRNRSIAVLVVLVVLAVAVAGTLAVRSRSRRASARTTGTAVLSAGAGTARTAPTEGGLTPGQSPSASPTSATPTSATPTSAAPKSAAAATVVPTSGAAATSAPPGVLTGKVIAIDPGHNGENFSDPTYLNHLIWNGRSMETCDTTGAETDAGYTEALFNFSVAQYLAADLEAEGASVVLTRSTNSGVGPCVNERAQIGNEAHAVAAVSIHADGGPASGRGFAVLEPVADTVNAAIVAPSAMLGSDIRNAFVTTGVEPVSTYDGQNGIEPRDDLGGLNLSTVPKVLVECANMRNADDAALLVTASWQQRAARALAEGLTTFLIGS